MKKIDLHKLQVDFNELIEPDLVLLSAQDSKRSLTGEEVVLYEGQTVTVYMEDRDVTGNRDDLIAVGVVERNSFKGWAAHVKWCCRIDGAGIRYESGTHS